MTLDQFVKQFATGDRYQMLPAIYCNDGFRMSVQGSEYHYCSPRTTTDSYYEMEVGYPSAEEPDLLKYAEDKDAPTNTVYGYVPVNIIQDVIDKHSGIDIQKTLTSKFK